MPTEEGPVQGTGTQEDIGVDPTPGRARISFHYKAPGVITAGVDRFIPLGGSVDGLTLTEAAAQLGVDGSKLTVLEVHVKVVSGTFAEFAVRDDGADVAGTLLGPNVGAAELSATGLSAEIAAGSKSCLRIQGDGGTPIIIGHVLVVIA